MSDAQDWLKETALRVEDARALLGRKRNGRAVSAAYYAVHAAGKGALLDVDVEINSHAALPKLLSYHFVRTGRLPSDTAARIQKLFEERLAADYDLQGYDAAEARAWLTGAEALIEQIEALV